MTIEDRYDDAMLDFSRGEYEPAIAKFKELLLENPANFDVQLALGMAYYRKGDFAAAIAEGQKAALLRPKDPLVHTNLSLYHMKAGDKITAEKHGLQAKIESWRAEAAAAGSTVGGHDLDPELKIAKKAPLPMKFPSQPWKDKSVV
jgi:Flp pilus assembly protein TadD